MKFGIIPLPVHVNISDGGVNLIFISCMRLCINLHSIIAFKKIIFKVIEKCK